MYALKVSSGCKHSARRYKKCTAGNTKPAFHLLIDAGVVLRAAAISFTLKSDRAISALISSANFPLLRRRVIVRPHSLISFRSLLILSITSNVCFVVVVLFSCLCMSARFIFCSVVVEGLRPPLLIINSRYDQRF